MTHFENLLARKPPEKLYHYTSVEGIDGIIRTRSVHATVVHYMNDSQEFRQAFGVARSVFARKSQASTDADVKLLLSHLAASLERIEHVRIGVFSLTEQGDLLSQWRGYCPPAGGYSVAFSPDFLRHFLTKHGFFLAPCTYDDSVHQQLVEEVIDQTVQMFQQIRQKSQKSFEDIEEAILPGFFFTFSRVAPIIKNPSFAEEREWRLVSGLITQDNARLSHRIGKSMLIPYYGLPLDEDSFRFTVEEIFVGPTPHQYIASDALVSLLSREGVKWKGVRASQIPYRQL